jgi:hypothetical protein
MTDALAVYADIPTIAPVNPEPEAVHAADTDCGCHLDVHSNITVCGIRTDLVISHGVPVGDGSPAVSCHVAWVLEELVQSIREGVVTRR